jgi:hypothetical protein
MELFSLLVGYVVIYIPVRKLILSAELHIKDAKW